MRIESLEAYVLVAQDRSGVTVFQRSKNWRAEVCKGREQSIRLEAIDFTASLSAIYEGIAV